MKTLLISITIAFCFIASKQRTEINNKDIAIKSMFNQMQKLIAAERNCIIKDKHGHEHVFKNCKVEASI